MFLRVYKNTKRKNLKTIVDCPHFPVNFTPFSKTFVGASPHASKTQIWTALIAVLLLRYLQLRSKCNLPLYRLFSYRNFWDWLDDPFETPPESG